MSWSQINWTFAHRDYYEQGAITMVKVYDDRVEISNKGGLLIGVQKDFGKKSMTINPLIFGLFTCMSLVEQVAFRVCAKR